MLFSLLLTPSFFCFLLREILRISRPLSLSLPHFVNVLQSLQRWITQVLVDVDSPAVSYFCSPFENDLEVLEPFSLPFSSAIFYANIKEKGGEDDNGLRGRITTVSLQ